MYILYYHNKSTYDLTPLDYRTFLHHQPSHRGILHWRCQECQVTKGTILYLLQKVGGGGGRTEGRKGGREGGREPARRLLCHLIVVVRVCAHDSKMQEFVLLVRCLIVDTQSTSTGSIRGEVVYTVFTVLWCHVAHPEVTATPPADKPHYHPAKIPTGKSGNLP